MKTLIQYNSKVSNLFHEFLKNGDANKLETELKTLEKYHKDLTRAKNKRRNRNQFRKTIFDDR